MHVELQGRSCFLGSNRVRSEEGTCTLRVPSGAERGGCLVSASAVAAKAGAFQQSGWLLACSCASRQQRLKASQIRARVSTGDSTLQAFSPGGQCIAEVGRSFQACLS